MREIKLYLTEDCNQNCAFCVNRDHRKSGEMDFTQLKKVFAFAKKNRFKGIDFMGGEPLLYSRFAEAFREAKKYVPQISIFTNGTLPVPKTVQPTKSDDITYNSSFTDNPDFQKNFKENLKRFSQHRINVVLVPGCDLKELKRKTQRLLKKVSRWRISPKKICYSVALNLNEDIFQHQPELNKKLVDFLVFLTSQNIAIRFACGFSHLPLCFMNPQLLVILKKLKGNSRFKPHWCSPEELTLLDVNFLVKYSNVSVGNLGSFFNKKGQPITCRKLAERVSREYQKQLKRKKAKFCRKCPHWLKECNGWILYA